MGGVAIAPLHARLLPTLIRATNNKQLLFALRTHPLRVRLPLISYKFGAGDGSRTHLIGLGSPRTTDVLHPHADVIEVMLTFLFNFCKQLIVKLKILQNILKMSWQQISI